MTVAAAAVLSSHPRLRPRAGTAAAPVRPAGWRIDGADATDIASGSCLDAKTHKSEPQPVSVQVRRRFVRDSPPPAAAATSSAGHDAAAGGRSADAGAGEGARTADCRTEKARAGDRCRLPRRVGGRKQRSEAASEC